jgi:Diadenosine tetraphosphate (Ap4A) hydrolase and other HIT family hydrolases
MACELCSDVGGELLWQGEQYRIVYIDHPGYPGYCRVIWHAHVKEMTDLAGDERARLLQAVFAVETIVRSLLHPEKVNLACLGNMTPHLHWHVIPRFKDDPHFPQPIWGAEQRTAARTAAPGLAAAIAERLSAAGLR